MLPGVKGPVSGHPLYFPHCFHGTGGQGQAFRGPGFRSASMLSGGFLHAFRGPCFQEVFRRPCFPRASRCPGIFELFSSQHLRLLFLLRILQAFSLQEAKGQTSPQASGVHAFRGPGSGGQEPGARLPASMLSGAFRGPGARASLGFFSGYDPITSSFIFSCLHKYTHFQDITPRFFSFFRITIQFAA